MLTSENYVGSVLEAAEPSEEILDRLFGAYAKDQVEARKPQPFSAVPPIMYQADETVNRRPVLALFCFENAASVLGQFVSNLAAAFAKRSLNVHLFARDDFKAEGVSLHVVGDARDGDLVDQVNEFTRWTTNEFLRLFQAASVPIALLGCEWSTVPVMTMLQGIKNLCFLWSVHSLERQRSDMSSDLSKRIEEIELAGLRTAKSILVHDPATAETAKGCVPECGERIVNARQVFPVAHFNTIADAGPIKALYQVGPIDPIILFVGDLSERYGPDLLVKAMPAILKNHPQARLVIVGGAVFIGRCGSTPATCCWNMPCVWWAMSRAKRCMN